jgi:phytoene dehydrogenase-like protein
MCSESTADVNCDVVVIGGGLAGLSCAALLSHCGVGVMVLESHDVAGGCAHTWTRRGYHFESGPSLYSGFYNAKEIGSCNPLQNIFQITGEEPEWISYDRWGTVLPTGEKFAAKIGPEEFQDVLKTYGGPNAVGEFASLMKRMAPLSDAAQALTSLAIREDIGVVLTTLFKYPRELFMTLKQGAILNEPFSQITSEMKLTNKFIINWLDMLCFLLQGLPASGTMNAVIAYMLADWYRPGVTLDFPRGGSGAIVDALVRGIHKNPQSRVITRAHVDEILVEKQAAIGVRLRNNTIIRTKMGVVSNADPFVTKQLLAKARREGATGEAMDKFMDKLSNTDSSLGGIPILKSFIHLHAGIDGEGLPESPSQDFPAQWVRKLPLFYEFFL